MESTIARAYRVDLSKSMIHGTAKERAKENHYVCWNELNKAHDSSKYNSNFIQ